MDETAGATTTEVAQVFDLHALKAFASDTRVRKMLFKTEQHGGLERAGAMTGGS